MANVTSGNETVNDGEDPASVDMSKSIQYTVIVPIFILACFVTFCMNLIIIVAFPLVNRLSRVSKRFINFQSEIIIDICIYFYVTLRSRGHT